MRGFVVPVTHVLSRASALALVVVLGAGPGAAAAFADSKDKKGSAASHEQHAHAVKPAKHTKHTKHTKHDAAGTLKKAKKAKQATAHPAHAPQHKHFRLEDDADARTDADVALLSPASLRLRSPELTSTPVTSVVITPHVKKATKAALAAVSVDSLLGIAPLAPAPTTAAPVVTRPQHAPLTLGAATVTPPLRQAAPRHAGLPPTKASRVALPPQGPSVIGNPLAAASRAQGPILVAVVGLLLVMLGARNVGRFRRPAAEDPDLDLTWD